MGISARLRNVRVCCGDWLRVLGPSPTERLGMTAIFLDPPYSHEDRDPNIYSQDSMTIAQDVAQWAWEHGDNPYLRIALCGYEGEFSIPDEWEEVAWKAAGGYASQDNENCKKERIWFSPHCLKNPAQLGLFDVLDE